MTAIEIADLVKHYGDIEALKGISFIVNEGEIFGLIGPNGAGKTTALRIVSTLLEITSGMVEVFGYKVKEEPEEVRKRISYLPEEAGAYKNLSGKEYLNFMAQFYADGKDTRKMVETGISISGLGERITDKVNTYSKGMTRKLLVARALMMLSDKVALIGEGLILDSGSPSVLKEKYNARNLEEVFLEAVTHE